MLMRSKNATADVQRQVERLDRAGSAKIMLEAQAKEVGTVRSESKLQNSHFPETIGDESCSMQRTGRPPARPRLAATICDRIISSERRQGEKGTGCIVRVWVSVTWVALTRRCSSFRRASTSKSRGTRHNLEDVLAAGPSCNQFAGEHVTHARRGHVFSQALYVRCTRRQEAKNGYLLDSASRAVALLKRSSCSCVVWATK